MYFTDPSDIQSFLSQTRLKEVLEYVRVYITCFILNSLQVLGEYSLSWSFLWLRNLLGKLRLLDLVSLLFTEVLCLRSRFFVLGFIVLLLDWLLKIWKYISMAIFYKPMRYYIGDHGGRWIDDRLWNIGEIMIYHNLIEDFNWVIDWDIICNSGIHLLFKL